MGPAELRGPWVCFAAFCPEAFGVSPAGMEANASSLIQAESNCKSMHADTHTHTILHQSPKHITTAAVTTQLATSPPLRLMHKLRIDNEARSALQMFTSAAVLLRLLIFFGIGVINPAAFPQLQQGAHFAQGQESELRSQGLTSLTLLQGVEKGS
ncbi:unnamed protein product [Effrenium voratum]|nr:unnamed protein product [Effrenium voratum]